MKLFLKRSVEMFGHCASCVLSLTVYSLILDRFLLTPDDCFVYRAFQFSEISDPEG
jgi:hypothetical protein